MMVQVNIDSVRVSLMSQHRIVVLKDADSTRYLPIWIGPFEADAITIELQDVEVARPLTHDLLKATIEQLGAEVEQVAITELRNDTFYAEITLNVDGKRLAIDSRPSDAIALAVRAEMPVYVDDDVMAQAAITPEPDLDTGAAGAEDESAPPSARGLPGIPRRAGPERAGLSARSAAAHRSIILPWPASQPALSSLSSYRALPGQRMNQLDKTIPANPEAEEADPRLAAH